jgi:transposase
MSLPCSIWLVTWSFGVDYSHMEKGPMVLWKSFFVTPYLRSCKGLATTKHFISGQPQFGHNCYRGWGVTVWGCFSFDCKLDLYTFDGNLTGQKYRDNVLAPRVVPHFDNHALADRPMFMDDNARPHRARIVQHFLQQEAVQTIPWPAMSPDMNPIAHVWDFIGRKINQRNPKCQNIDELRTAILQEWQQFPRERLGLLCETRRGVLQNFTIHAVDILVIHWYALHIRTTDAFKSS